MLRMKMKKMSECKHPGCSEPIVRGSYCKAHAEKFYVKVKPPEKKRSFPQRRGGFNNVKL